MWPVVNVFPCPRKCHTSVDTSLYYLSQEDRDILGMPQSYDPGTGSPALNPCLSRGIHSGGDWKG